jgi:positive regulator of sigma E activity
MKRDILVFLFFIGFLLFNWPSLAIFEHDLATYLFVVWFLYIGFIFLASFRSEREDGGN